MNYVYIFFALLLGQATLLTMPPKSEYRVLNFETVVADLEQLAEKDDIVGIQRYFAECVFMNIPPMYYAAASKSPNLMRILLTLNYPFQISDKEGLTPLHGTAEFSLATTQLLIENKADVNALDHKGRTPLWIACINLTNNPTKSAHYLPIIKLLLEHGADLHILVKTSNAFEKETNDRLLSVFDLACISGNAAFAFLLLRNGACINGEPLQSITPLARLIDYTTDKHYSLLQILLKMKPDADYTEALHASIQFNNNKALKIMLDAGVSPELTRRGFTPLMSACMFDNTVGLELLIKANAPVNTVCPAISTTTALHMACLFKNSQCAQILLDNGANISIADEATFTALHCACIQGNYGFRDIIESPKLIVMLLARGASEILSQHYESILDTACSNNSLQTIKVLAPTENADDILIRYLIKKHNLGELLHQQQRSLKRQPIGCAVAAQAEQASITEEAMSFSVVESQEELLRAPGHSVEDIQSPFALTNVACNKYWKTCAPRIHLWRVFPQETAELHADYPRRSAEQLIVHHTFPEIVDSFIKDLHCAPEESGIRIRIPGRIIYWADAQRTQKIKEECGSFTYSVDIDKICYHRSFNDQIHSKLPKLQPQEDARLPFNLHRERYEIRENKKYMRIFDRETYREYIVYSSQ